MHMSEKGKELVADTIMTGLIHHGLLDGASREGRWCPRAQRGADLRYDLELTFEDAAFGTTTKVKVPRHEVCAECSGSGAQSEIRGCGLQGPSAAFLYSASASSYRPKCAYSRKPYQL